MIESKVQQKLIRVTGYNIIENELVPEDLKSYCCSVSIARENTNAHEENVVHKSGVKLKVSIANILKYDIIIGTCSSLGALMYKKIGEDIITHVFFDEAGQLSEPDALIPLTYLSRQNGQIVLAGDPEQLGPVILSSYATKFGLSKSLLRRLMQLDVYKRDVLNKQFDPRLVTQLVRNYRSIPSIMTVYSQIFYENTLINMINDANCPELQLLAKVQDALPVNNFYKGEAPTIGLHFVPVNGTNRQEINSPSWHNHIEVNVISRVLTKLLAFGVNPDDIGIISPYQLQVRHLKEMIRKNNLKVEPKVGSVEEFQGMERKIILISTVRTSLSEDKRLNIGFIGQPERVNVAISRARSIIP